MQAGEVVRMGPCGGGGNARKDRHGGRGEPRRGRRLNTTGSQGKRGDSVRTDGSRKRPSARGAAVAQAS